MTRQTPSEIVFHILKELTHLMICFTMFTLFVMATSQLAVWLLELP